MLFTSIWTVVYTQNKQGLACHPSRAFVLSEEIATQELKSSRTQADNSSRHNAGSFAIKPHKERKEDAKSLAQFLYDMYKEKQKDTNISLPASHRKPKEPK